MSRSEFDVLDAAKLTAFVGHRIEEGSYIDYKEDLAKPLTKDKKKELLKDVTGFANAAGGLIIFGCKEPDHSLSVTDQLCGLADGLELSSSIERILSDCLDPRVPGIGVKHVLIESGLSAIVIFIPLSSVRPHMSIPEKRFYMRHSESTLAMNSQEVKTAVISAYNRKDVMESMKRDVETKFRASNLSRRGCCIVIQAIPLTEPSEKWPVFDRAIKDVLYGLDKRTDFHSAHTLSTGRLPRIDVEETFSTGENEDGSTWELHVRADGHVYLFAPFHLKEPNGHLIFSSYQNQLFCVFGAIVDELLAVTNSAHGYQIETSIKDASALKLYRNADQFGGGLSDTLNREQLNLPTQVALAGGSVEAGCEDIGAFVYQAFGVLPAEGELKKRGDVPPGG